MKKPNLFWSVYKNLEKEFLKLADIIHITDDQLDIYSMHIADLIIRCSVEIESISKELYAMLGGNLSPVDDNGNNRDLYFDTDCLDLLEQKWKISKKEIVISTINCYFSDDKILTPLHKSFKRGTSGSKWKQAYQAVKHDRINSLKKANIENLLNALGALFILNLYYKENIIEPNKYYMQNSDFDSRAGSDIFSVFCYNALGFSMTSYFNDDCIRTMPGNDLERSIYIDRYNDASIRKLHEAHCKDHEITMRNFYNSPIISKYIEENPNCIKEKDVNRICAEAGDVDLVLKIMSFKYTQQVDGIKKETILNKHSNIYPELKPLSKE